MRDVNVQVEPPIIVSNPSGTLRVELDQATGAPCRLWLEPDPEPFELAVRATVITGGDEVRGRMGGLEYPGAREVTLAGGARLVEETDVDDERRVRIAVRTTEPVTWDAAWVLTLRDAPGPRPRLSLELEVTAGAEPEVARNVHLEVALVLSDPDAWLVDSPGNPIRRSVSLPDITREVEVSPAAGVSGSAGMVAVSRPATGDRPPRTFLAWPLPGGGLGTSSLLPSPAGLTFRWVTDVAGRLGTGGSLRVQWLHLDLLAEPYEAVLARTPSALAAMGVTSPADPPDWAVATSIYEVQIGFGVFSGGFRYEPYPTMADLLADLPRIADLGFDCIQVMPRQPYPSYNVHDYADITTSYGDEDDLRALVQAAHARGMRVILDILMHGVIDGEIMEETLAGIHSGPYADRLDEVIPDVTSLDLVDPVEKDLYPIAWCAHIVNFGPYWIGGSPRRHPLADEHPEWFCRDSASRITGVYTKAFDLAHPGWRRWFIDAALDLVRRLDIDGFRFDAPMYNAFHNWSERTQANAAVSMVGCLDLFVDLRRELRALRPDALLYTEPSGVLYRQTMDMVYNYDEQFLVRSVMTQGAGRAHWVRSGRELARWLADRDATLSEGSLTVHHLDSHDSFWWPHPGQKWRREQYGLPATAAWMTLFALSGGPYMTFVGGETGIEDEVRRVHAIRRSFVAFARGVSDPDAVDAGDERVYAVVRRFEGSVGVLLVNLSDGSLTVDVTLAPGSLGTAATDVVTEDLLGGPSVTWSSRPDGRRAARLALGPWASVALAPATGA